MSFCLDVIIKEKEPTANAELIVHKDRLDKIAAIAIAQLAIKQDRLGVTTFFSELSKNFNEIFT